MQNSKYALPAPKVIQKDFNLLQDLRKTFDLPLLEYYPNQPFKQIILTNGSKEYNRIRDKFSSTEKWNKISQIRKIENPFILLHYLIAKSKFLSQNDKLGFEEKFYFHGTGEENLTNICGFNFDRSKIVTHKFGKGISFAKKSSYASYYPYKCTKINKVMVIARMFYDNPPENGSKTTIIPKGPSYTSKNENGTVLVKYDDASYYPAYIIYYVKKYNKEYDDNDNYYDNGFEDYYDYDDDYEGDFYDKYGVYCEDDFIIDDKPYYKNNYTNKDFKDDDYHDQHYDDKDNKHYYDWYDDFYTDDNYYECDHNIEDYWIENYHYEDCYDYYE